MSVVSVDVVVFDLGGVIVDLSGLERFLLRHNIDPTSFWPRWLGAGTHAGFERGDIDADEFAVAFVAEFRLSISPDEFITEFTHWPSGLMPGARELVSSINVPTATLSNTNPIHWHGTLMTDLATMFDRHFPSYQLGLAKPDPAIFERVVSLLEVPAPDVVFFDDNEINVVSARSVGLQAHRVDGPAAARQILVDLGVIATADLGTQAVRAIE